MGYISILLIISCAPEKTNVFSKMVDLRCGNILRLLIVIATPPHLSDAYDIVNQRLISPREPFPYMGTGALVHAPRRTHRPSCSIRCFIASAFAVSKHPNLRD